MPEYTDLGQKMDGGAIAQPSNTKKVYYPHLCITSSEAMNFPDEGEAMIRFKKKEDAKRVSDDKTEYRCDLEITGIKPMGSGMMKGPKKKTFSESLDEVESAKESATPMEEDMED